MTTFNDTLTDAILQLENRLAGRAALLTSINLIITDATESERDYISSMGNLIAYTLEETEHQLRVLKTALLENIVEPFNPELATALELWAANITSTGTPTFSKSN